MTIPEGTTVVTYAPGDATLSDEDGYDVEGGVPVPVYDTFGPSSSMPDYTLDKPNGLHIYSNSITTNYPRNLSELLSPNMGTVHWAACTVCDDEDNDDDF